MKKILLATAMCAVFGFAGDNIDLLALATGGVTKGSSYELSSNEMQDIKGGMYVYERTLASKGGTISINEIRTSIGKITEGCNGMLAKLYVKKVASTGVISYWVEVSSNGTTYNTVTNSETRRLIALYGATGKSYL
jgi:hypothetical protein